MKKTLPILIIASSALVVCAGIVTATNKGFDLSKATNGVEENTITFTVGNIVSYEDSYGVMYFELTAEDATYYGYDYSATAESNYCYGSISASVGTNGHIFEADGGTYYADVYFGITLPCGYMDELTKVTLNGNFYYNSYKTNPTTSLEYTESDLSGDALVIYEGDLYKAELDSIVIEYSCLTF